ncbi:heterokaryon incompatibility protein-domain-containing protein [Aspergillus undulatus]|uniref:heterokaryon incompatibility protein-domain-containing protein n=1 Tax=Aspergillus undulatus TaxID=1810928 RepID=UPI003CCDA262
MYRWHESGCRRPDVSAASGLPCCSYCFAIPLFVDHVATPQSIPQLQDRTRMNLKWPSAVTYSNWDKENKDQELQDDWDIVDAPSSETRKPLLPELPFEDSIRLLRLEPGRDGEPLHADLETVNINQIPLPLYEALSYTAVDDSADSSEPCPVFIGNYWDVAHVSSNCGKALRRLRRHKGDRFLWVDALCIDHANPEEKNAQVHILREIYSRATKVLAYVGDEQPEFAPALSFLREITTYQPTLDKPVALDEVTRSSLSTLLKQPYFSRIWVLQETLMARELEIVCGEVSARWPKRLFSEACSDGIPSWLFRDSKWYAFTGSDLLNALVNASPYQSTDPRDKVFAVLGLMGEKFIRPDYRLPIESIYTGIAAYFIKFWHTMDIFALGGQNTRVFDLPSWVPDWSQNLSLPSMDTFSRQSSKNDTDDFLLENAIRIKFSGVNADDCYIEVSSATGAIRLRGFKMCEVSGNLTQFRDYTHVELPSSPSGSFVISIPHQNYTIGGSDGLFLLRGYEYPVILREGKARGTYTLLSACVLSIRSPTSKLVVPWYQRQGHLGPTKQLTVSPLTPEDDNALQRMYSRLDPSPVPEIPAATIRTRVLNFLMLSHAIINRMEKWLRVDWFKYNQELGWMFRDQSAIWQFLLEVNQLDAEERTGEDKINYSRPASAMAKHSGTEYLSTYTWDLSRFCWSFLQPTNSAQAAQKLQWSPMVDKLRAHLPEIRKWAQVTEQLLGVFEYTSNLLGEAWQSGPGGFPGLHLPTKWASNYERFIEVSGPMLQLQLQQGTQQTQRPHLDLDCLWSMAEFESQLRAREDIWALRAPDEMHSGDTNIESHALLHYLGLDLSTELVVNIV